MAYLGGLLLAANLGERHVAWKWAAYAMLSVPAVAVAMASVLGMLLLAVGGRVGQVAGGVSVERQVAGTLILFVAGILAVGCLLPPLRSLAARLVRGFRADSALHAISLGLYFGTLLAFISLQISTDQLKAITQSGESPPLWFIIVTNQVPFLVIAIVGVGFPVRRTLGQAAQRLGLYWPGWRWFLGSIGFAVVLVIFGVAFDQLMVKLTPQQSQDIQQASEQLLRGVNSYPSAIALALAAGIGEEVLFRGALMPRLGNLPAALLFAVLHAQYAISLATLEILILGLVLGWLRRRAGTTGAIIAHAGYDMILLVIAVYAGSH
ncbi:MAG TPA: CPBP family intramembrane glutamic endopeptidase [Candidatus Dormibacteraeota bacterium]|nr:CPBP family intramembrane glutamic endopeptidase [Candidatus Dormibacteraeota bacterium]